MDWATALAACRRLILAGVLQSALLFWSCVLTTPQSAPGLQVNDDGTMARTPELLAFAAEHGLKCITIADLVRCTGCVGTVGSVAGGCAACSMPAGIACRVDCCCCRTHHSRSAVVPVAQVRYRLKHDPLVELTYATQLRTRWVGASLQRLGMHRCCAADA